MQHVSLIFLVQLHSGGVLPAIQIFNQPNSTGHLPMFSLVRVLDARFARLLLDKGADVNNVDSNGRTILLHLTLQLSDFPGRVWDAMDAINICLSEGFDIFSSDNCRCACAPDGCSLAAAFNITFGKLDCFKAPHFVWGLEFLSLVEDQRGREVSRVCFYRFCAEHTPTRMGLPTFGIMKERVWEYYYCLLWRS
ncbi:hypothetical protein BDW59DRAFT_155300 [Aspergillus cavernicola]|uniref:Ankyrin repeat-containing domain protein n=1 Tax=Aspergillus cavernicola TaxID=176166 RepID=A0ABR4HA72_9EURO